MPASLILVPSSHQIGPSPSQTWVGVQLKVCPEGITSAVATEFRIEAETIKSVKEICPKLFMYYRLRETLN